MASQDNDYSGPDVLDTIPLYACYWQLAEMVDHTQRLLSTADREHDDLLPRIYPAGQLEAARTDHRKKAVARDTLTLAFRYQNLQLWVRPQGKPDIPLASDTILDLDKNSFEVGAYIPLNDDEGWLSRRPLFIKEVEWNAFVDTFRK